MYLYCILEIREDYCYKTCSAEGDACSNLKWPWKAPRWLMMTWNYVRVRKVKGVNGRRRQSAIPFGFIQKLITFFISFILWSKICRLWLRLSPSLFTFPCRLVDLLSTMGFDRSTEILDSSLMLVTISEHSESNNIGYSSSLPSTPTSSDNGLCRGWGNSASRKSFRSDLCSIAGLDNSSAGSAQNQSSERPISASSWGYFDDNFNRWGKARERYLLLWQLQFIHFDFDIKHPMKVCLHSEDSKVASQSTANHHRANASHIWRHYQQNNLKLARMPLQ